MIDKKRFGEILENMVKRGVFENVFRRSSIDGESPEDQRQSFLCQFWERISKENLGGVDRPEPYIRKSARNFRSDARKRQRRSEKSEVHIEYRGSASDISDFGDLLVSVGTVNPAIARETADEGCAWEECVGTVFRTIANMPPRRREVMLLRMKGYTYLEIADAMDIAVSTAVNHHAAARKNIDEAFGTNVKSAQRRRSSGDDAV